MVQAHNSDAIAAIRLRFWCWAGLMLAMLGTFAWHVLPRMKIETDIVALLPNARGDDATRAAVDRFSDALAGKMLVLVGAADLSQATRAAQAYAEQLRQSEAFTQVRWRQNEQLKAGIELYLAHRAFLLAPQHFAWLNAGQRDLLRDDALRAAYTPTGLMRPLSLAQDPLGLGSAYLLQQATGLGAVRLHGDLLVATETDTDGAAIHFVLMTLQIKGSPFAADSEEAVMTALRNAQQAAQSIIAPAKLAVVMSGTLPHADAARRRATGELSLFGAIETVLVMALLFTVFSALRPLALGAMTMGLAFVAGLCATHFVFGEVHLLALVFGSSLIGGVIDYSIHFFADRFRQPRDWTPIAAVAHVGGAIVLGMCTTLLSYVVLLLVPFPGLRQMALFCVAGLLVGCVTVLCAYPMWYRVPRRSAPWGPRVGDWLARYFLRWRWTTSRKAMFGVAILVALGGFFRLQLQDDVRALQSSPPHLIAAEQRVAAILKSSIESRYFIVQAADQQTLLANIERLAERLDALKARSLLADYMAVTRTLPSLQRQQASRQLLRQQVLGNDGVLAEVLRRLGFSPAAIEARLTEFEAQSTPFTVTDWSRSEMANAYGDLWLGALNGRSSAIVSLSGIKDIQALRTSTDDLAGVQLIDRVGAVSDVLRSYRRALSGLLCVVYLVAYSLLAAKFGWREAPLLLLPSALASAITLGLFGWFGVPVNLFCFLALWLVLGLGVDYGIFLRHGRTALPTAVLSVTLSAITTLLAFGMLALSATPFIRSIGLTLLCAIGLSWLLAMLCCLTLSGSQIGAGTTIGTTIGAATGAAS